MDLLLWLVRSTYCAADFCWKVVSKAVPAIGRSWLFGSWIDALMWMQDARDRIQQGYDKVRHPVWRFLLVTNSFAMNSTATMPSGFLPLGDGKSAYAILI